MFCDSFDSDVVEDYLERNDVRAHRDLGDIFAAWVPNIGESVWADLALVYIAVDLGVRDLESLGIAEALGGVVLAYIDVVLENRDLE